MVPCAHTPDIFWSKVDKFVFGKYQAQIILKIDLFWKLKLFKYLSTLSVFATSFQHILSYNEPYPIIVILLHKTTVTLSIIGNHTGVWYVTGTLCWFRLLPTRANLNLNENFFNTYLTLNLLFHITYQMKITIIIVSKIPKHRKENQSSFLSFKVQYRCIFLHV